jgi:hypothetical protein
MAKITISEGTGLTTEDARLVRKWGIRNRSEMRAVVLVGRLQRTLIEKAPALANKMGLLFADGRMGPHTRRTLNKYNGTHPEDPIELGPELAPIVVALAEVPEPPITLDALEDPPDEPVTDLPKDAG